MSAIVSFMPYVKTTADRRQGAQPTQGHTATPRNQDLVCPIAAHHYILMMVGFPARLTPPVAFQSSSPSRPPRYSRCGARVAWPAPRRPHGRPR